MKVALLPGDGVGPEVVAEARKVVDVAGVPIEWTELPWGSTWWREHGEMMPGEAIEVLRRHDAILMGAVGDPAVPDPVALWGFILKMRQGLDLWANVRPARLLEGVPCPLAGRVPADVDIVFVRENTEGEYAGIGGHIHPGFEHEAAVEVSVFSRRGTERVVRHAFEVARGRSGCLINATKSNASRYGYVFWDEVVDRIGAEYPDVRVERVLVDALCARIVRDPGSVDVVVASNLFGDILTDLAAAIQGGLGMAASANLAPGSTDVPGLFEPVHGSAPDIAGQGIANPCGAVWSATLMLDHLGEPEAARRVMGAIESVCREGPRTPDIGGEATTVEVGDAIARIVAAEPG